MKLVTWNINSLNARHEHVANFLDRVSPTVLCMQELKLEDDKIPREIFEERGYHLATHGQPTYNGVAIASKIRLQDVATGFPEGDEGQSRYIAATIDGVRVINLYCPQGSATDSPKFTYKLAFFDALIARLKRENRPDQPLILTGDINIAPAARDVFSEEEMTGQVSFTEQEHARWKQLEEWGLTEVTVDFIPPGTFSFWDYRARCFDRNRGFRIDHVFVTRPLLPLVQFARIHREERAREKASDHAPVALDLAL